MLKRLVALALGFALLISPSAAYADDEVGVRNNVLGGAVEVSGNDGGTEGPTKPATVKVGTGGSGGAWVDPYAGLSCWEIYQASMQKTCEYDENGVCSETIGPVAGPAIPLCADPAGIAAVTAARTQAAARAYAIDYFKSIPLPVPQPVLSAPEGITGAVHQLNLQTEREVNFTDPETAFGQLYLYCYATYEVSWGDGTKDTYNVSGAAYPNSPIKHSWSKRGTYAVDVTARWSADWTFGAYSGTLSGLNTNGSIPAFPVGDLQAVITG